MSRSDLLSLGPEDLASLSNRGNVNRATKELDQNKVKWEISTDGDEVQFVWSDGPTTTIPAGTVVSEAICTCPATSVCRHIVRAVLAYQRWHAEHGEQTETVAASGPWDPGSIDDELLESSFRGGALTRWRSTYEDEPGLVVELVRSTKPTARFHRLGHTIRFLVPNDPRYTRCDCDEPAPCRHVPLAIWAFRALDADRHGGVIETCGSEPAAAQEDVAELLRTASNLVERGLAETPKSRIDRVRAAEQQLRDNRMLWPAEVIHDLLRQWDHYHSHDARFSPSQLAELLGELVIRHDALLAEELPIPRLFVRGEDRDGNAKLGQTKLVGLGTAAVVRHGAVDLVAVLQDTKSGKVMSFVDTFPDPPAGSPRHVSTFAELAARPVFKGRDYATLGRSQVVVKSVRLNPNHTLALGRSATSAYGQDFRWDALLAPLFSENLAELRARIESRPPASLRPRRFGEDFVVLPVSAVRDARFDSRAQMLRCTVLDTEGEGIELQHPYSNRGRSGLERALQWLSGSAKLLFVAARARMTARGLILSPTGLVFEDGSRREIVQPWIDDMDDLLERSTVEISPAQDDADPLDNYRAELSEWLGNTAVVGLDQRDLSGASKLLQTAQSLGMASHQSSLAKLASEADAAAFLELLVASKLAHDLG